jgi:hypothetical protein
VTVASAAWRVESWDPGYGSSTEGDAAPRPSSVEVTLDVELPAHAWRAVDPPPGPCWPEVLFVDGVRRIDAMGWLADQLGPDGTPALGLFASYAAGVVRCRAGGAQLLAAEVRRGLFTTARTPAVSTSAGTYLSVHAPVEADSSAPAQELGQAVQARMRAVEAAVSQAARAHGRDDLLVVDGPLHDRTRLPRTLGYVKTHRTPYLPAQPHRMVGTLAAGQRTPLFGLAGRRPRYSWYLKLPESSGAPWAGVVRVECSAELAVAEAVALADRSAPVLCRHASSEYKDARAPQNLYPIAGLERELRRRLGDQALLHRAIRAAVRAPAGEPPVAGR